MQLASVEFSEIGTKQAPIAYIIQIKNEPKCLAS